MEKNRIFSDKINFQIKRKMGTKTQEAFDVIAKSVEKDLLDGHDVIIENFGTFKIVGGYDESNPDSKIEVKFIPGKRLQRSLRRKC